MADRSKRIFRRRFSGRAYAESDAWVCWRDKIPSSKPLLGASTDGGATWMRMIFTRSILIRTKAVALTSVSSMQITGVVSGVRF